MGPHCYGHSLIKLVKGPPELHRRALPGKESASGCRRRILCKAAGSILSTVFLVSIFIRCIVRNYKKSRVYFWICFLYGEDCARLPHAGESCTIASRLYTTFPKSTACPRTLLISPSPVFLSSPLATMKMSEAPKPGLKKFLDENPCRKLHQKSLECLAQTNVKSNCIEHFDAYKACVKKWREDERQRKLANLRNPGRN